MKELQSKEMSSALDKLAAKGCRWLWRARFGEAWRRHLPKAMRGLLLVPMVALVLCALGWLIRQPWKFTLELTLALLLLPTLLYLVAGLIRLWGYQPTRREGLASYDDQLQLKDRLQTADEFLGAQDRTPFMEAALEDCQVAVDLAQEKGLLHQPPLPWNKWRVLVGYPLLTTLLVILGVLFPAATRLPGGLDGPEMELASIPERSVIPPEPEARAAEEPPGEMASIKKPEEQEPKPVARKPTEEKQTPPLKTDNPSPQVTGREKVSIGESEGGQSSQAISSGRSSQSRGMPGSQSPPSSPDPKPTSPKKQKPKDPKDEKESDRERKKMEDKSGATAGRGSSSGSSRNPASTDWSSKDRTEETENEEFEQEEDVDDEDSESEARGGLQPNLRDRRPPVNRDLSIGFGNQSNPDANGRGGPGQRKKSRGVASLVLGVPVPDHVKGQPNPGRVKINQERVQPQPEDSPAVDAQERGERTGPAGQVPERLMDASKRRVVREYFLKSRDES